MCLWELLELSFPIIMVTYEYFPISLKSVVSFRFYFVSQKIPHLLQLWQAVLVQPLLDGKMIVDSHFFISRSENEDLLCSLTALSNHHLVCWNVWQSWYRVTSSDLQWLFAFFHCLDSCCLATPRYCAVFPEQSCSVPFVLADGWISFVFASSAENGHSYGVMCSQGRFSYGHARSQIELCREVHSMENLWRRFMAFMAVWFTFCCFCAVCGTSCNCAVALLFLLCLQCALQWVRKQRFPAPMFSDS